MLSYQQLKGILTQTFIRVYTDSVPAPSFLKSFFPSRTYTTATVMLEVSRGTERIAADILPGTRGNRNTFSKWTAKEFLPPQYKEFFDATQLDHYDRVLGAEMSGAGAVGLLAREIGMKFTELRKKIERAKELQCSQVLETGVVELINGDNIDFKRRATSMVDVAATGYWSSATAQVEAQLEAAAEFIRKYGKNGSSEFNLIISGSAYRALKETNYWENRANWRNVKLIDITQPQKEAFGPGYHGTITAGSYTFHIWTYDEVYESSASVFTRFWPAAKAIVLPTAGYDFEMSHAAVPSVIKYDGREIIGRTAGEYFMWDVVDKNEMAHYYNISSAPVALPVSVDMIYTMQVLSSGGQG